MFRADDDDDGGALSNALRNNALQLLPLDKIVHNSRTLCDMASHLCSEALKISKKEAKSEDAATKSARRGLSDLLSVGKNNPVKTLTRDDTSKVDKRSDFVRQAGCRIHAWMGLAYLISPDTFHVELAKQHGTLVQKFFPDSTHDKTGILSHMIKLSIIAYSRGIYTAFTGLGEQAMHMGAISKSAQKKLQKSVQAAQQEQQSIKMMQEVARDLGSERFRKERGEEFARMLHQFLVHDDELVQQQEEDPEPGAAAQDDKGSGPQNDDDGDVDMLTCKIEGKNFELYKMDKELSLDSCLATSLALIVSFLTKTEASDYHEVMTRKFELAAVTNVDHRIEDALRVDLKHTIALVKLGYHLMLHGQFREAYNVFLKFINVARPGDPRFYMLYLAGECYVKAKINQMTEGLILPNLDAIPEWKEEVDKRRKERKERRETKGIAYPQCDGAVSIDEIDMFLVIGEFLEKELTAVHKAAKLRFYKEMIDGCDSKINLQGVYDALGQHEGILGPQDLLSVTTKRKEKKKDKKKGKKDKKKQETSVSSSSEILTCAKCGILEGGKTKLSRCGRCQGVTYCSRECQVADWTQHKLVCKIAQSLSLTIGGGEEHKISVPSGMALHSLVLQVNEALSGRAAEENK